ncbi:hypothetical protein BJV78DRAFT_1279651 [Lactifluus subvellereus]|nr:hypothetical protein BJV78DRAFT_1279651 [Lactifluus subvellereus]
MEGQAEVLPEYSPNPGRPLTGTGGLSCEHRYALRDCGGRDWFSFNLKSRAADPKHIPVFLAGDTIRGEVQVDLGKAKTLKGLTVTIRGGMVAVGQEEDVFLDKTEPVWTPASSNGANLIGQHTYPFSISIPRDATVTPAPNATPRSFSLPPTFSERASPAYIDYRLYVTVRRGGMGLSNRLSTSFAFLPRTVADPPSPLRALVYAEGEAILGPDADPEGWKVYEPVKIAGTLFTARDVSVQCTLAVATPFTYASNSPIPLLLTLRGTDVVALDLFARSPNLHLLRTVAFGSESAAERGVRRWSNNTIVSSVAKGVFWPHEAGAAAEFGQHAITREGDRGVRVLQGELFVPKGSKPSFTFPWFACRVNPSTLFFSFYRLVSHTLNDETCSIGHTKKQYTIALLPPEVPGFAPATAPEDPLLTERVTITMANAPGITPSSQIPPSYESPTQGKCSIITGNGNQQFLS